MGEIPIASLEVSVIFPVRNEEQNLRPLHAAVTHAVVPVAESYELLFVDDGSTDQSLAVIKSLQAQDPHVRYVSLSRPFGHQAALLAGMAWARGCAVIMMDADLQHPPELLPEMLRHWRDGYDVVYTVKQNTEMPWHWQWQMRAFYTAISRLSGLRLRFGQSDFRLIDRKVVEVLNQMPEHHKFLRGLVGWVGFRQVGLRYQVRKRERGRSKYSYRALARLALDGLLSFSTLPLRLFLGFGALIAALTLSYMAWVAALGMSRLAGGHVVLPPGWATITVAVLWLGSLHLITVGMLGEYVARIYDETKGRPAFIVREHSDDRLPSPPT